MKEIRAMVFGNEGADLKRFSILQLHYCAFRRIAVRAGNGPLHGPDILIFALLGLSESRPRRQKSRSA